MFSKLVKSVVSTSLAKKNIPFSLLRVAGVEFFPRRFSPKETCRFLQTQTAKTTAPGNEEI